ncbi:MAG: prepilin-type N-terminal cleavage/methylation domain-containing protein, partial [Acidimicrobiia bacterium]
MLKSIRDRRENEEGFTLIELMVVVLIIAILIAIAIPTFLGARERANDRAAQSSLRNGLTAAKTIFTDASDYTQATDAALAAVEPSLTFDSTAASSGPKEVNTAVTVDTVTMAAESTSGECFWIRDDATGPGTEYGRGTGVACSAATAPP